MKLSAEHWTWLHGSHSLLLKNSADQQMLQIATWARATLLRREKLFYKITGDDLPPPLIGAMKLPRSWTPMPGQVELVDAGTCRAETGGEPGALYEWHAECVRQAFADGHCGAAFTGDMEAQRVITDSDEQLIAHEAVMQELTRRPGVRALCRYDHDRERSGILTQALHVHHRHVDHPEWCVDVVEDVIVISGDIDDGNAGRLHQILAAATQQGAATVDLANVTLLSVTAMRVFAQIAREVSLRGGRLVLINPSPFNHRVLVAGGLAANPDIAIESCPRSSESCLDVRASLTRR